MRTAIILVEGNKEDFISKVHELCGILDIGVTPTEYGFLFNREGHEVSAEVLDYLPGCLEGKTADYFTGSFTEEEQKMVLSKTCDPVGAYSHTTMESLLEYICEYVRDGVIEVDPGDGLD